MKAAKGLAGRISVLLALVLTLPVISCRTVVQDAEHFVIRERVRYTGEVGRKPVAFSVDEVKETAENETEVWYWLSATITQDGLSRKLRIGNRNASYRYLEELGHYWCKIALNLLDISPTESTFVTKMLPTASDSLHLRVRQHEPKNVSPRVFDIRISRGARQVEILVDGGQTIRLQAPDSIIAPGNTPLSK